MRRIMFGFAGLLAGATVHTAAFGPLPEALGVVAAGFALTVGAVVVAAVVLEGH